MKTCTKCKQEKHLDEFSPDNRRHLGKASQCKKCNASYCRKRHNTNKELARNYKLMTIFNISLQEYNLLLNKQNKVCAICLKNEITVDNRTNKVKNLAVDHCHKTGKVRGLLCANCNIGLGKFKEDFKNLNSAIEYLKGSLND